MPNQAAARTFIKASRGPWAGGAGVQGPLMKGPLRPRSLRSPGHSLGPLPSPPPSSTPTPSPEQQHLLGRVREKTLPLLAPRT